MRFSVTALGLAVAVEGAVLQARDTGCTVNLEATTDTPSGAGEIIAYGSINRWVAATGLLPFSSTVVDYSGSLAEPYSFKYKANAITGYETDAEIEAVLSTGWVGTYLRGVDSPAENTDFLITSYSCN
ncbi:hypothetical protein F5Y08DRAFT_168619 [Xylaria arbuscula]|nr:hypothetical protein F5Y08DRAFT_168619 [Xylaria arbuscula]